MAQYGEKNHFARLTEDDVRAIRQQRKGGMAVKDIARRHKISPNYCSKIIHHLQWKRVK